MRACQGPSGWADNLRAPISTEELGRDGSTFRLISMQFSLSDLELKDSLDSIKSTLKSFVHNLT